MPEPAPRRLVVAVQVHDDERERCRIPREVVGGIGDLHGHVQALEVLAGAAILPCAPLFECSPVSKEPTMPRVLRGRKPWAQF